MKNVKMAWYYGRMVLIGSLLISLSLATTALSVQAKNEAAAFRIGIVTSLSGPGMGYGQRAIVGARYKIEEEVNKAGGINGHPVKLFVYDTETRPDQTAMLVERAALVDKVLVVLGPNASSDGAAAFPTAKRLGVVNFSFSTTLRGVVEKNAPWAFSPHMSNDYWMEPITLLFDQFKIKSIVVMADEKYNSSIEQANLLYKIAEREGVKVLARGKLNIQTGWADFAPQMSLIKSLQPDLIASTTYPADLAHLAVSLRASGIDSKVVPCFSAILMPDVITAAGEAVDGWYGTGNFDSGSTDPQQKVWLEKVTAYGKTISNDPAIYTAQYNTSGGYVAASFVCEAIKRTNIKPDTPVEEARAKIRDEIPKITMAPINSTEMLRLGQGGRLEKNRIVSPMYMFQVQNGKLTSVGRLDPK